MCRRAVGPHRQLKREVYGTSAHIGRQAAHRGDLHTMYNVSILRRRRLLVTYHGIKELINPDIKQHKQMGRNELAASRGVASVSPLSSCNA